MDSVKNKTACIKCNAIISDKAEVCPECGYSMEKYLHPDIEDTTIVVNGVTYNIPHLYQALEEYKAGNIPMSKLNQIAIWTAFNWDVADNILNNFSNYVEKYLTIPKAFNAKTAQEEKQEKIRAQQAAKHESLIPKCPKCGSTAISTGKRGYSLMLGFIGAGNTVNRCANCGHSWRPGSFKNVFK